MALADTAKLVVALQLDDRLTGGLRKVQGQLKGMESGLSQMGRGVGQVGSGLDRLGTRAAIAAAGGLTAVVTTAASFESAFAGVAKTVDATGPELRDLESDFRELARTIPLSFEELAAIGEQGGALGIAKEDLIEFTEIVAELAATTNLTAEDAATGLGQLQNVLGLTGDDLDNFGAALVDLGNKGASTESDILQIATRAGAAGKLIGLSADEVLGFGSAVANLGINVEAGGTSLQKFFLGTLENIQKDDTLEVMAETAGTTGDAFKKAFEKDATGALEDFIEGLGDLTEAEQLATLEALGFSDQRITQAILGLAGDTDNLTDSLKTSAHAWEDNTALAKEFEKRQETTAAKWTVFKNNARDALATIGHELLPVANEAMSEFVGFLNEPGTRKNLKDFAKDLAQGVRDLADELKGTDFTPLLGALEGVASVAKGAFDAFRSLPAPIQQLAIAALVANKVSGGAIGQIAGGLANIFGGALKTIFAGHVTVIGKGVTGGGGGPGLPPGLPILGGFSAAAIATLVAGVVGTVAGGTSAVNAIQTGTPDEQNQALLDIMGGFPALIGRSVTDALVAAGILEPPNKPTPVIDKPATERLEEGNRYADTLNANTRTVAERAHQQRMEGIRYARQLNSVVATVQNQRTQESRLEEGNRYANLLNQNTVASGERVRTEVAAARARIETGNVVLNQIRDKPSNLVANVTVNSSTDIGLSVSGIAMNVQRVTNTYNTQQWVGQSVQ